MESPQRRRGRKPVPSARLDAIVGAEGRDRIPGARPVVARDTGAEGDASDPDEARAFLDAVDARTEFAVALQRRGAWHGEWAELDPATVSLSSPHATREPESLENRWHAARPIVIAGAATELLDAFAEDIEGADALRSELENTGGLRDWLARCAEELAPGFVVLARRAKLFDPERDIERVLVESIAPQAAQGRGRKIADLWLKSSWLSTHEDDSSLRLRFSFGREGDDDASRDILRHRLVAELAAILLPESALITENPLVAPVVERLCGEPVLFTQGIAYWNSPHGGALFHHDAFGEDRIDGGDTRQLGVCYLQLSGSTAWLALSIEDLAARVREFVAMLEHGEKAWVRAQLFEGVRAGLSWPRLTALVDDDDKLVRELGLPGCGALALLVNRGPEFTAFLADKGHAAILHPGDAILLPNQGVHATCMHSVFCASEETGYSLSLAIRPDRESMEEQMAAARSRERAQRGSTPGGSLHSRTP